MEFHPLANLFPLMEGGAFDTLRQDVDTNDLREPLTVLDGMLLDGRNRFNVCTVAGKIIPPEMFREFDPATQGDPLAWVISINLHRRHLNESQRADVAAQIANLPAHRPAAEQANLPTSISQTDAAAMLNVSERSIRSAVAIRHNENTTAELQHAVVQGHLTVSLGAIAAKLPKADQREIATRAEAGEINVVRKVVKQNTRREREKKLGAKQRALPDKKYGVILADPEWKFETWSEVGGANCSAENHYTTSSLDVIKARDVPSISADDCVLFLWATVPMALQAHEVMTAWGFQYVTNFAWAKDKAGTGYWNRNKHETLLVGTKGKIPVPAPGTQWPSVIEAPVREHSAKPEKFLELIEAYFPTLPKIELNRRGPARDGWDAWGLEAGQSVAVSEAAE
jgi:N6-adenosine-specific RNA methylase IME4